MDATCSSGRQLHPIIPGVAHKVHNCVNLAALQLAAVPQAKGGHPQVGLPVVDDVIEGLIGARVHLILAVDRLHHNPFQPFHSFDLTAFAIRPMAFDTVNRIQVLPQ